MMKHTYKAHTKKNVVMAQFFSYFSSVISNSLEVNYHLISLKYPIMALCSKNIIFKVFLYIIWASLSKTKRTLFPHQEGQLLVSCSTSSFPVLGNNLPGTPGTLGLVLHQCELKHRGAHFIFLPLQNRALPKILSQIHSPTNICCK